MKHKKGANAGAERRTGSKRKWLIAAIIFMGIVVCAEIVFMIWSYR